MKKVLFLSLVVLASYATLVLLSGCSEDAGPAQVDRFDAQAQPLRPVAAEVKPVSIPADPNLPTIVIVVEDFVMAASGVTSGNGMQSTPTFISSGGLGAPAVINVPNYNSQVINPGQQIGPGVSAQLISALSRVGNVKVYDYTTYKNDPQKIIANIKPGELGPYVIKGTVTEFAETADSSSQGESKGPNPGTMLIPYVGGIIYTVDALKGRKSVTETRHTGMVGLDVRVVNTNGQIVSSFTSEGTFTTLSMTVTQTKGGKTTTSSDYAASALGQAQIMALNKVVLKIHETVICQKTVLAQG